MLLVLAATAASGQEAGKAPPSGGFTVHDLVPAGASGAANRGDADRATPRWVQWLVGGLLVAAAVVGIVLVMHYRSEMQIPDTTGLQRLDPYKEAFERGLMADEEFERIQERVRQGKEAGDGGPGKAMPEEGGSR